MAVVQGSVVDFKFQSPVSPNKYSDFYIDIKNVGSETGQVFAVLVNSSGNPGDMVVMWEGSEWIVSPGGIIALRPTGDINPGETFRASSTVKYKAEGTYNLKIQAWHKNPLTRVDEGPDDEKTVSVEVTVAPPPPPKKPLWPILLFAGIAATCIIVGVKRKG